MKRFHIALILISAIMLAGSIGWGYVWIYAARDTVPKGVALVVGPDAGGTGTRGEVVLRNNAAIDVGGNKIDAALKELEQKTAKLTKLPLTIEANLADRQKKTWTLGELGLTVDTTGAAYALSGLREGSVWERAKYRWEFPQKLVIQVRWNKEVFAAKVRGQWGWIDADNPTNAVRSITADDKVVYQPHVDAFRLDLDKLFAKAQQMVEASIPEEWGGAVGAPDSSTGGAGNGITLPLALRVVHPDVTLEQLKNEGIERKITSFTTDFSTSGAGRAYNVSMTARTLNDWDLAPGEVFDYRKVISLTRQKYGYRQAPVILNGELVPGIGGGICQVSSTLYNAALLAGLNIVERRNHSLPVSYMPKGQDATFAEGAINFRFKNTTGKHLIIRTVTSGGKLTIKLFGTMPRDVSYRIESKTVKVIDPPVKEVPSSAVPAGGRLLLTTGKPGYIVETYRTMTKGGKTISRERLSRDTYKAQPSVYGVGPGRPDGDNLKDDSKGSELLEDGVSE
ncbi:VanW family protein [Paenibacillus sp. sptzw28]|uniref:VanW family protein n=1 Tax=Paenibacillus sp. sptzw28 TaxID=715179 RepID=UPI001C6E38F9|nr:VanW family protein [Paenibacillus sp. sptzw28]QYR22128.1 VanW family protein [Paenibacillus sp. sptzw28]